MELYFGSSGGDWDYQCHTINHHTIKMEKGPVCQEHMQVGLRVLRETKG